MYCRTERRLDRSGISIAPPKRERAATTTIAAAPTRVGSARIRRIEQGSSESDTNGSKDSNETNEDDEIEDGDNDGKDDDNNNNNNNNNGNGNDNDNGDSDDNANEDDEDASDEDGTNEDDEIEIEDGGIETDETETEDTDENEAGEIEGQVGETESQEIEVGEIEGREIEVGEVEDWANAADLNGKDRSRQPGISEMQVDVEREHGGEGAEFKDGGDEIGDRGAQAEAMDPAGRTRSTATQAKAGGEVQLAKIPAVGLEYSKVVRLPPFMSGPRPFDHRPAIVATRGLGPDSNSQSIPLDRNVIARHYAEVSPYKKRDRSASPESQHNKSQRISASHSSAITRSPSPSVAPSTKWSTRGPSPSVLPSTRLSNRDPSPLLDHDPQGSSSTTGGVFRGRALGGGFRFADAGKLMPMLMPAYYNIFCPLEQMDVDLNYFSSKISGKVLLYTSRDLGVSPAMTVNHDTVNRLSPVLQKLARRFSPLRSKFVHTGHCDTVLSTLQRWTAASMYLKTRCGLLRVASLKLSLMMILLHGMYLVKGNTLFLSLL